LTHSETHGTLVRRAQGSEGVVDEQVAIVEREEREAT
jgi:hypothetical protein